MAIEFSAELQGIVCADCSMRDIPESYWGSFGNDPVYFAINMNQLLLDVQNGKSDPTTAVQEAEDDLDIRVGKNTGLPYYVGEGDLSANGELILACFKKRASGQCRQPGRDLAEPLFPNVDSLAGFNVLETILTRGAENDRTETARRIREVFEDLILENPRYMEFFRPWIDLADDDLISGVATIFDQSHEAEKS